VSKSTGASFQYVVLRADGSKEVLRRTAPLELKELQRLVGGYVEAVRLTPTSNIMCMVVNEEGRLDDLPPNPYCPGIVGNVVLGKVLDSEFVGPE
jgi:Domain of unknown function (DUF3846)